VQLPGTIDGYAGEEVVLCQEFTPLIVDQRGIRLKRVVNGFAVRILFLQFDDCAEEINA